MDEFAADLAQAKAGSNYFQAGILVKAGVGSKGDRPLSY